MRTACQDDTTLLKVTFVRGVCKATKVTPLVVVNDIPLCGVVTIIILSIFGPKGGSFSGTLMGGALGKVTAGPVVVKVITKFI